MTTETAAANALADENARLRGVIQQQNRAIRALTEERDAARTTNRKLLDDYYNLHGRYQQAERVNADWRRDLLAGVRRAASHLPGNPDAAEAVLSGILEGR